MQIANHTSLQVNLLLSLREDALARLDRFKGRIPFLLDNRLTLGHLSWAAGREAIQAPLDQYNRDQNSHYSLQPALVEAVLAQVGGGQVTLDGGRQNAANPATHPGSGVTAPGLGYIEAPYLQLVMTRLWEAEQSQSSQALEVATLEKLGGAERIVRNYLDGTLDALSPTGQALAAGFLDRLVTPSGTKIALALEEMALYAVAIPAHVEEVVRVLQNQRLLRGCRPRTAGPSMRSCTMFWGRPCCNGRTDTRASRKKRQNWPPPRLLSCRLGLRPCAPGAAQPAWRICFSWP